MRLWMDVMRHLEPVVEDHQRLFDAWEAGGVDGIVVGPLAFADKSYTFDPNPEVYARFGLQPPRRTGPPLWVGPRPRGARDNSWSGRRCCNAGRPWSRPWSGPRSGAGRCGSSAPLRGPPTPGPILTDDATRTAVARAWWTPWSTTPWRTGP